MPSLLRLRAGLKGLALLGVAAGLTACSDPSWRTTPPSEPAEPKTLADVVVTDPNFDFSTTQSVRLQLRAAEGSEPKAVEVTDSEGRRLMDGAFKSGASIDLRLPVGKANAVKLRVGSGAEAVERELTVDGNATAVGDL